MSYRGRGRGGYGQNNGNNSRNGSPNVFGAPPAAPFGQSSNSGVQVEIWGWNNATPSDLVSFLSRKTRINVSNTSVNQMNGAVVGYVRSQKDADTLMNWNGVKFAGQSLKFNIINNGAPGAGAGTNNSPMSSAAVSTVESLKQFLTARYNPQLKMLDLSNMQNDHLLVSRGLIGGSTTSATSSKMFMALMKLLSQDPNIIVETVNLANNQLNDTFTSLSLIGTTFPTLLNLSLDSNRISRLKFFETWKGKFTNLRELVLLNNPVQQANNYQFEIMKIFPKLILLDGQILRDEVKLLKIFKFPIPTKQMFFETPDIHNIATSFISNYLKLWDSNRQELMGLYSSPESQFSVQVDSLAPSISHEEDAQAWSYYLPNSRNLSRISNERSRMARLHKGAQDIYKVFQQLPRTKHMLIESPQLFSVESYSYPQINGIVVIVHGEFDEVAIPEVQPTNSGPRNRFNHNSTAKGKLTKKSFDRTFVIVQGPDLSMIIASDLLLIRAHAGAKSWTENGAGLPLVPLLLPLSVPLLVSPLLPVANGLPTPPLSANTITLLQQQVPPDILNALSPVQQQLLGRIFEETKLNAEFSLMLCQQSNWDYQTCITSFNGSKSNIPINAYQH